MTRSCGASSGATAPPSRCNSWRSWKRRLRRRTTRTCSRGKTWRSRSTLPKPGSRCGFKIGGQNGGKRSG